MEEDRKQLEQRLLDVLQRMTEPEREAFWDWVRYDLHICID